MNRKAATKKRRTPRKGEAVGRRTFDRGLPYVDVKELSGKLVVVEGTDGVGRSVQIDKLCSWLESRGHAVTVTGLTRSELAGEAITRAKEGNTLSRLTRDLFYATDFADLYERRIVTALRAGFVVLADRYVYTLIARAEVRGSDPEWVRGIYGFALVPDVVFYLDIDVDTLVARVINDRTFDYWESGMDLGLADDRYESFRLYQSALLGEFRELAREYSFDLLDARRSPETIQRAIRKRLAPLLEKHGG